MKRKILIFILSAIIVLMVSGCATQSDTKSFSSENGDKPPFNMTNVEMLAMIDQKDTSLSPILISIHLKNNTDTTFTDVFLIELSCADGSTGNVTYSGDIKPGEAAELTGVINPKTSGKEYYTEDLIAERMLTGFDPGDDYSDAALSYYPQTGVYSWDLQK